MTTECLTNNVKPTFSFFATEASMQEDHRYHSCYTTSTIVGTAYVVVVVVVVVGTTCASCKATMPTRMDCPSCGVNAPAMDFLPDQEAW